MHFLLHSAKHKESLVIYGGLKSEEVAVSVMQPDLI